MINNTYLIILRRHSRNEAYEGKNWPLFQPCNKPRHHFPQGDKTLICVYSMNIHHQFFYHLIDWALSFNQNISNTTSLIAFVHSINHVALSMKRTKKWNNFWGCKLRGKCEIILSLRRILKIPGNKEESRRWCKWNTDLMDPCLMSNMITIQLLC